MAKKNMNRKKNKSKLPYLFFLMIIFLGLFSLYSYAQGWQSSFNTGLVGYWKLDDLSGGVLESVYGQNGTLSNATTIQRGGFGLLNSSYNFTAFPGQYVLIGNLSNLTGSTSYSYSLWFQNNGTGGASFGYPIVLGDNLMLMAVSSTTFFIFADTSTGTIQSETIPYSRHKWNHVAWTYNSSTLLVYVNGTLNSTTYGGVQKLTNTTLRLGVGSDGGNRYSGGLDEIGFWNRTLTASEISTLYNEGFGVGYLSVLAGEGIDVILNAPPNAIQTINRTLNFTANQLTGITLNHTNITFYIWNGSGSILNRTTFVVSGGNGTSQTANLNNVNFTTGTYSWNAFGCGVNGTQKANCTFAPSNFTFEITNSEDIGSFYRFSEYETANSTFIINVSVTPGTTFYTANLIYNGTSLKADTVNSLGGGQFQLIKTLDIPGVIANTTKNFFWQITVDTGSGFALSNTSVQLQNISVTNVTNFYTSRSNVNYTIFDEDTLKPINSSIDNTFSWYLGSGTERDNRSFTLGISPNFTFANVPSFINFYADVDLELYNATTLSNSYERRQFNFVGEKFSGNLTKEQPLYLLKANNGTNVVFEVKDSGLAPLENYLVKVYRYYPSTNTYRMVESKKTDLFGQITSRLIENTIKYKIEFYDETNSLVKTVDNVYVVCRNAVCSQQFIIEDSTNYFDPFNNLTNYEYSFTFNNNSNTFVFIWNDQRGQNSRHHLEVSRKLFNGTTEICNATTSSSTSKVGSLSCAVGNSRASYQAQAFRTVSGDERRIAVLNVKVGDLSQTFGKEGLIWSLILLGTMILIGSFNPPIGVVLYLVGVFALGLMDIIYISPAIMIAEIVVGVLFIWAFRG